MGSWQKWQSLVISNISRGAQQLLREAGLRLSDLNSERALKVHLSCALLLIPPCSAVWFGFASVSWQLWVGCLELWSGLAIFN